MENGNSGGRVFESGGKKKKEKKKKKKGLPRSTKLSSCPQPSKLIAYGAPGGKCKMIEVYHLTSWVFKGSD